MVAGAANVASGAGVSIVTVGGTLATSGITLTLSNVTVFNAPVLWLVTGRPTYTGVGNVIVVRPSSFQVAPSLLQEPITVVASRFKRSQTGTDAVAPAMKTVLPPFALRLMNSTPPPGLTSRITCADPAVSAPRIITPAFARALVFWIDVTRATISPLPDSGCDMKWKASAVPQMSAPAPRTVKTPPDSDALPAIPTDPMSFEVHGDGKANALTTLPAVQ